MKSAAMVFFLSFVLFTFPAYGEGPAFQCSECHSKNPKLVRMHRAVGYKDCMLCHKPGNFSFGQSSTVNTPTPEQAKRMAEDPVCQRCHGAQNTVR